MLLSLHHAVISGPFYELNELPANQLFSASHLLRDTVELLYRTQPSTAVQRRVPRWHDRHGTRNLMACMRWGPRWLDRKLHTAKARGQSRSSQPHSSRWTIRTPYSFTFPLARCLVDNFALRFQQLKRRHQQGTLVRVPGCLKARASYRLLNCPTFL